MIVRRQSNNWIMLHIKFCMCFWRWVMGAQVKSFTFIAKIFVSSDLHKRCLAVSSWISCPRHLTWKLLPRNPLLNSQMTALTACNHSLLTQARNLHCNLHGSRCCEARCHMVLQKALLVQKDSWQMLIGGQVIKCQICSSLYTCNQVEIQRSSLKQISIQGHLKALEGS